MFDISVSLTIFRPGLIHRPGDGTCSGRMVSSTREPMMPPFAIPQQLLLCDEELSLVRQHPMQHDRQLACQCYLRLAHPGHFVSDLRDVVTIACS